MDNSTHQPTEKEIDRAAFAAVLGQTAEGMPAFLNGLIDIKVDSLNNKVNRQKWLIYTMGVLTIIAVGVSALLTTGMIAAHCVAS